MTYLNWFRSHAQKHHRLVQKLLHRGLDKEAIIDYFDFDNMAENEPDFCELYKTRTKCHDMESLNCYLCACPNFRFNDNAEPCDGITTYSHCAIDSKEGAVFEHDNSRHQDCSGCTVPHHKAYICNHFNLNWLKIMAKCQVEED